MSPSFLDRRAGLFAAIYLAVGALIFAPFWKELVSSTRHWPEIALVWPVAFPIWGYALGSRLAGEAGRVSGVLAGIALIPVALILLSQLVDLVIRR